MKNANNQASSIVIPPLATNSTNCLPSRSTIRSRDSSRHQKKKVAMSLCKVNAFAPGEYELGLGPTALIKNPQPRH